jgi:phosphoribosylglycinamide formyltransferase 2
LEDTSIRIFGKPYISGHRRMAVLLARANSVDEARKKVQQMAGCIKVEVK